MDYGLPELASEIAQAEETAQEDNTAFRELLETAQAENTAHAYRELLPPTDDSRWPAVSNIYIYMSHPEVVGFVGGPLYPRLVKVHISLLWITRHRRHDARRGEE